jgi:hypothetical protein
LAGSRLKKKSGEKNGYEKEKSSEEKVGQEVDEEKSYQKEKEIVRYFT